MQSEIGAFELKRTYQRNLGMGILWAAIFHIALIGGFLVYKYLDEKLVEAVGEVRIIKTMSELAPPPSMIASKPQVNVAEPNIAPPSIGIPTPVPDEEVVEEVRFATREELIQLANPDIGEAGDAGGEIQLAPDFSVDEYFPAPEEFVAVQEMPIIIKEEKPIYPEVAQLTNREGTVWVKALVDKEGKVREARIAKSSGMNVGFDEVALEAAYKNIYKPAIQNGKPVAIWVSYPVEFKLK